MSHIKLVNEVLRKEKELDTIRKKGIRLFLEKRSAEFQDEEDITTDDQSDIYSENGVLYIPADSIVEIKENNNDSKNQVLECYDFEKDGTSGTVVLEQYYNSAIQMVSDDEIKDLSGIMFRSWFCLSDGKKGFVDALEKSFENQELAKQYYNELLKIVDSNTIESLINLVIKNIEEMIIFEENQITQLNCIN